MQSEKSTMAAILWSLGAAAVFTVVYASAKIIGAEAHPIQIVFMRYFGACVVIITLILFLYGGFSSLISPKPSLHVLRAVSGVFGEFCIISAPLFIAYEDATAVTLTNGVIAMLLAVVLLKERAGALHWLAAFICLAGAMVIARSETSTGQAGAPVFGLSLAVFGAVLSGAEMFFIKMLSDREPPIAIMAYVSVLAVLMLGVPAIWFWKWIDGYGLLWLLAVGPVALFGQLCWIRAFRAGDAILVVPIGYSAIPFAALLGSLLFKQKLGALELSGGGLVVLGGILLARLGTDASRTAPSRSAET